MKKLITTIAFALLTFAAQSQTKWEPKPRPTKKYSEVVLVVPGTIDLGWVMTDEPLQESTRAVDSWPLKPIDHCKPTNILIKSFYSYGENVCYVWDGYKFQILYVQSTKSNDNLVRWNPSYIDCNKIPKN